MTLEKYYNKEIFNTFTSITLFIISIVSANLLIKLFQKAYSQGLGIESILKFIILTIPQNIILITPISIFLAIIISFGKYFANNEMFVTLAGGVTWMQIIRNTLKPVFFLTLLTFITLMYINPLSNQTLDIYKSSLSAKALLLSITNNKIIKTSDGKIIYIENKSGNTLNNIFLYKKNLKNNNYEVITSPKANIVSKYNTDYINLKNVNIYTENLQNSDYSYNNSTKVIYKIFDNSNSNFNHQRVNRLYMHTLLKKINIYKNYKAEFFQRINNSISVIISSLLALALCRLKPKQNKYAKLVPSVSILAMYLCTNMFINNLMKNGNISIWIGIWLPHLFFLIFSIKKIRKDNGSHLIKLKDKNVNKSY